MGADKGDFPKSRYRRKRKNLRPGTRQGTQGRRVPIQRRGNRRISRSIRQRWRRLLLRQWTPWNILLLLLLLLLIFFLPRGIVIYRRSFSFFFFFKSSLVFFLNLCCFSYILFP